MSATTVERDTIRKGQETRLHELPLSAQKCLAGTIAVLAAGFLAMGTTATSLTAVGRFEETVDNAAGAAGDKKARVLSGMFWWANATAGDAVAQANVGAACYVLDNQTVTITSSGRSKAGIIVEVDAVKGVLVSMGLENT